MEQITDQLKSHIKNLFNIESDVKFERTDPKFGDYSTNIAMQLSKSIGKNPRDIANEIISNFPNNDDISEITIAGPGFINIRLSDKALIRHIYARPDKPFSGKKIVFEYSCPNAFKELHTGHLYQTIYGDIVSRMMLIGGADLQRTSFGGDVGLHVAKCMWGIQKILSNDDPTKLEEISTDTFERARWISKCYVKGASDYEQDDDARTQIDELNKSIYKIHEDNDHDSNLAKIYWQARQWSYEYFDAFYKMIDVVPMRYYPESETAPIGLRVIKEQLKLGNLEESNGAVVFRGDESKHLHTRVFVTSQGLPTYETKDIGVIWLEKSDYNFDHRYLITGNDQKEYMRVVYAAAEKFNPELKGNMTHLTNGTVKFADGTKMSSRLGNVSRAADIIDAVKDKVSEIVGDKTLISEVAIGSIKYAFAKYKLGGDINFNLDETVSLHGNSGPYIQYAHARARRILEKSSYNFKMPTEIFDEDYNLIRKLGEYHEVINLSIRSLEPHYICNYLFELAQEFNRYYETNKVIGSEKEQHRTSIVALYADILKAGLTTLGITAPDKM